VTEPRHPDKLRAEARRCRRLAGGVADKAAARALNQMADEQEAEARDLEKRIRKSSPLVA
jgi:hypothetical protein